VFIFLVFIPSGMHDRLVFQIVCV